MIDSTMLRGRDFLVTSDLSPAEYEHVLDVAATQKREWSEGHRAQPLAGKSVAIILQKPSMRTRISFEVACARLGAHPLMMTGPDGAFSRAETVYDTAKVMERYVDAIVVRTFDQALVEELAEAASVPVINALTDDHHPCQGLADMLTIREHLGRLEGVRFTYVGDGNNMAHTYLLAGALLGMKTTVSAPDGYQPKPEIVEQAKAIAESTGADIALITDPREAVAGAEVVATDTWASMGQEDEHAQRLNVFEPYRVDHDLMAHADSSAIFLHCLPAHRGEEVTDSVIDSSASVVFDEAENRLHVQKALLSLVLG
jgi:ornithine carbamoyltransferase